MTSVVASADSKSAFIAGHGILVSAEFELAPGIIVRPSPPHFDLNVIADGCKTLGEYAIILAMMEFASFYLEIQDESGGKELATKAWNSLWLFPLLALGCHSPCTSLYSWSGSQKVQFAVATPHTAFRRATEPVQASNDQLTWARANLKSFESLQKDETFTTSLMSYTNSHHLFGHRSRIMQLWSGIECLFKVNSEIARTLAMYSALLLEQADAGLRYELFKEVKKDYGTRSKVVHGNSVTNDALEDAYLRASNLLARLLSRCVELSRVPSIEELDRAALVGHVTAVYPELS
jgi:hypothetical protein